MSIGKKEIASKWVFRTKYNVDGTVNRYKTRLVVKGYNQLPGIDYHDSFSPITKIVIVRAFMAIATSQNWKIHQLDINNAYIHGHIDEDIYMEALEVYQVPKG